MTPSVQRRQERNHLWHYEKTLDRESAYEKLRASSRARRLPHNRHRRPALRKGPPKRGGIIGRGLNDMLFGRTGPRGGRRRPGTRRQPKASPGPSVTVGREIIRGVLGSLLGGKRAGK